MASCKPRSIVFINPPGPQKLYRSIVCTFISKANYIWQPQDFINLSAHIPIDYDLRFYDCSVNKIAEESLFKKIESSIPQVAVISLSSIVYEQDFIFLKNFKKSFPDVKVLILGDIFLEKMFWGKGLKYADGLILNSIDNDIADYIKTGISLSPNLVLKERWLENKREAESSIPTKTSPPKKVSIGISRHELFINRKYRFPFVKSYLYGTITTQFGCIYRCNYCSWSKIPVTYRNYNEVLEEIEKVYKLGIRDIFFGDPSFGFPSENAGQLLEGLINKNLAMRWVCYTNPALYDLDFLKLMKKAGCHTVIVGVDDEDMDMLKEKYNRTLSRSKLIDFCRECNKLGINICGDFIIGLNSNENAIKRMVEFAKMLKLDYASFNILTPLLGSEVREKLITEGTLDPYAVGFDTSGTFGQSKRLVQLRNIAVKKFYLRPSYLIRRITSINSLTEFRIQLEEMIAMLRNFAFKQRKGSE